MALPSRPQESTVNSIDKGVYLSTGKITGVQDFSNHSSYKKPEPLMVKKKDKNGVQYDALADLCLEITYETESGDERKFKLFGGYNRDITTGTVKSWITSKSNGVNNFLFTILTDEEYSKFVRDDWAIDEVVMNKVMVGKAFKEVKYVAGTYQKDGDTKMSTRTWKHFNHLVEDTDIVIEWERTKITDKYIRDTYKPDVVDIFSSQKSDLNTVFPYGDNANKDVSPI